jgi:hypothetical protein
LRFAELCSPTRKQRIRNFQRSLRCGVGVVEHKPVQIGEIEIGAVVAQTGNLRGGNAVCPTYGRANVNSRRASPARGDAKFREALPRWIDLLAPRLGPLHLTVSPPDLGLMPGPLNRHHASV